MALRILIPLILLCVINAAALAQDAKQDPASKSQPPAKTQDEKPPQDELTTEAQDVLGTLEKTLSKESEARLMLDEIVKGSMLGPDEGWFRVSHSASRFSWDDVSKKFDVDQDQKISNTEFPGSQGDFRVLDRNGDRFLTSEDLQWPDHALARTPGLMLFFMADGDGNGKVTRDEFVDLFKKMDTTERGFVSLDEMKRFLQPPPESSQQERPDKPSRSTLILGLARQEIGSLQSGPAVGDTAPDFTLKTLEGDEITLSKEVGAKPIVLIFGNFTCGPFRSQAGNLEKLAARYSDRAKFLLIYVREAHPKEGWWMTSNQRVGIDVPQPRSNEDRQQVAALCRDRLELDVPFLVDDVHDTVGAAYSGMPNRLYLIDSDGRIAFKSGRGPFGFKPAELEQSLIWLTAADSAETEK